MREAAGCPGYPETLRPFCRTGFATQSARFFLRPFRADTHTILISRGWCPGLYPVAALRLFPTLFSPSS
ncbi:MAG: hypothetical protein B6245_08635 [Desulfobacteraceae bacterium 4572_88]|nr:MAG: hypothetical protein B6245_08635 [Desulfobacteraceae bacterium 4572_88]